MHRIRLSKSCVCSKSFCQYTGINQIAMASAGSYRADSPWTGRYFMAPRKLFPGDLYQSLTRKPISAVIFQMTSCDMKNGKEKWGSRLNQEIKYSSNVVRIMTSGYIIFFSYTEACDHDFCEQRVSWRAVDRDFWVTYIGSCHCYAVRNSWHYCISKYLQLLFLNKFIWLYYKM